MLLAKIKLNSIEVLISKTLSDKYINYDEFGLVNNMLREYNEIKEEIKNPENAGEYTILKTMENYCVTHKKILQKKF